mgnify:CR=1 FL=1
MQRRRKMLLFMKVLFTQFIAEMGDKTQLMLVAMTSRFKLKDILLGTGVAVLVLNGLAVLAGGIISTVVPTWLIRLIAGAAFLFFAVTTLKGDDDEEENVKDRKIRFAPLSVFCTFFCCGAIRDRIFCDGRWTGGWSCCFSSIICML